MFLEYIGIIGRGITAAFGYASEVFGSVGIVHLAMVAGFVVLSVFLRLFAKVYVGERVTTAAESYRDRNEGKFSARRKRAETVWQKSSYKGKYSK